MKFTSKLWLLKVVGIAIFAVILGKMDMSQFAKIWPIINVGFLGIGVLLTIAVIIAHAIKWKYICNFLHVQVSIGDSIIASWAGCFMGLVTPGKIGDLARVYFLDAYPCSRFRSMLSVVVDRVSDVLALAIVGGIGAFIIFGWELSSPQIFFGCFLVAVTFFFALITRRETCRWVEKILVRYVPALTGFLGQISYGRLSSEWRQSMKGPLYGALLSLPVWLFIYFLNRYFLLMSLHIPLSFIEMTACVSLSTLFTFLPISISGIGTRDVSLIYLFSFYGLKMEQAIAFSTIILVTDSLVVCLGYIPYYRLSPRLTLNLGRDMGRIGQLIGKKWKIDHHDGI